MDPMGFVESLCLEDMREMLYGSSRELASVPVLVDGSSGLCASYVGPASTLAAVSLDVTDDESCSSSEDEGNQPSVSASTGPESPIAPNLCAFEPYIHDVGSTYLYYTMDEDNNSFSSYVSGFPSESQPAVIAADEWDNMGPLLGEEFNDISFIEPLGTLGASVFRM